MNNSTHKVVLITGTSRGLGKYLVENFMTSGYHVVACSRGKVEFKDKLYTHMEGDIADPQFKAEVFKFIKVVLGRLDVLINNAVFNPSIISSILLPYDDTERALKLNVLAPMMFCQEAIKIMRRNKYGRIINIGSMVTKHTDLGGAIYSTCKSAIDTYSKVIARDVSKIGITVNVLAVSAIKTDLSDRLDPAFLKQVLSRNAIPEMGEMSDIANLMDFLIKEESSAITGQVIYLGGA